MMRFRVLGLHRVLLATMLALAALGAERYTATRESDHGVEVIRLSDIARGVVVSIVPSVGNRVYELKMHGKNILYFPQPDVATFKNNAAREFNGIPFLAPWANRIAGGGFWANGTRYNFQPDVGTVRVGRNGIAIHGMLTTSPLWEVTHLAADDNAAELTSQLLFWKQPGLMANWPFAHEYEMTYRLSGGVLEVSTAVKNLSAQAMPMVIGFHPYFNFPDVPRSEASAHIAARKHVETDAQLVATGELTAFTGPEEISLKDHTFDDGFTDLVRDSKGHATFSVHAGEKRIEVVYGPKYQVAVVYAPPGKPYICFEPMTAITNGINLAHDGKYPELQMVAPGAMWQESFWIRASGF